MPRATNPWAELLNTTRWRKSGNLAQLKTKLWRVIAAFEKGLDDAMAQGNGDEVRRWGHALNQVANTYFKIVMDGELEHRIRAIEEKLRAQV